ncbi:ABC transporter permease [Nesterenkonia muleiensis]|uniref:ABC transporter permease n=1 Tax=Nesterenkonia muleiensis TaxID=2282648 RepID=UPI000E75FEAB|nr:ABC transporter permease [Nesterenkonia muleiensis]
MTVVESGHDLGSNRGQIWKSLRSSTLGMVGAGILMLMAAAAILAPLVAPHPPTHVNFGLSYQPPLTRGYVLGTDDLGRDILSRMLYGIRVSLQVGVLSVAIAVVVGVPLGLLAGYWRWLDGIISRLTDLMLAFPFLILAVGLAAINGPSLNNAVIALGVAQIPIMLRVVRGETLRIKASDFVTSAEAMNASGLRIMGQHVLPNCTSAIIVQATVIIPVVVIGEALLSFLGIGVQPPTPSLGIMLSDAQQYISQSPTAAIFPGTAIVLICLGFNLFGDALRDALDPSNANT